MYEKKKKKLTSGIRAALATVQRIIAVSRSVKMSRMGYFLPLFSLGSMLWALGTIVS